MTSSCALGFILPCTPTGDLLSCKHQWFDVLYSEFWIQTKTPTTKTSVGRFTAYLPKLRHSMWDLEFWLQVLSQYRDPNAIFLFVVPGEQGKGCMKFTPSRFDTYFINPLNQLLEDLDLVQTGKRFTVHSFRYSLASSWCDELLLPEAIVAIALKHVAYKQGQYSATGSIYQLSGQQSLALEAALKKYARENPNLGKAFLLSNMDSRNKEFYERFIAWKVARKEITQESAKLLKRK